MESPLSKAGSGLRASTTVKTIQDILHRVEDSPIYNRFHSNDPSAFLAHFFIASDDPGNQKTEHQKTERDIQVGYYDPSRKLMTTFVVGKESDPEAITVLPDLEVFQKPGSEIMPLDTAGLFPDWQAMLAKAHETQKFLYPGNLLIKQILILQHLSIGPVYNITFFTRTFQAINLQFDAASCALIKHHMDSLLSVVK